MTKLSSHNNPRFIKIAGTYDSVDEYLREHKNKVHKELVNKIPEKLIKEIMSLPGFDGGLSNIDKLVFRGVMPPTYEIIWEISEYPKPGSYSVLILEDTTPRTILFLLDKISTLKEALDVLKQELPKHMSKRATRLNSKKAAEELTLYSDPQSQMEYLKKVLRHLEENLKTVRDPNHRKWLERKRYETMVTLRDLEVQKPIYEWKDYAKEIVKLQEELKRARERLSKWEKGELSPAEIEDLKAQEREEMMPVQHILESDVYGLEEQIAEYQRSPEEIASYEKYYKEQEEGGAKYEATPPNPHPDEAEWTPEGTLRYYEQPEEPEKKPLQLPEYALKLSQRTLELSKRAYTLQENCLNPQFHGPDNEITPYAADDIKSGSSKLVSKEYLQQLIDDDGGKSYEETKDDSKWQKVLLSDGKDWTRKEIRDHYAKNADKILKEIKDHPVMIYIGVEKNKNVLKRHHNDKPIVINNKEDLMYWADRRLLSIHRVFGPKTKLGFVDLDVHGDFSDATVKKYAREIAAKIKSEYSTSPVIYDSGGSGYHIEFVLKQEKDTDTLRNELRELCEDLNEKYDGFTTGIVKGNGVRTDTTTLKNNGNIRVPYALHESKGGVKKPLGSKKALSKNDIVKLAWGISTDEVKKIYELEYKLHMLSQRKELGDNAYLLKHKYESELNRLLDRAFVEFNKGIDGWVDSHEYAVKNYDMTPEHKQQIFDYWDKMVDLQDKLSAPPKNLKDKIVLFHIALNTAHMTGRMAEYFVNFPSTEEYEFSLKNPTDILDELSSGQQVPQWESEISRIAADVKTMYGIGEDLKDHLYKLPANDRGFLDTDNNTFVGMIGDIKNRQYIRWVFSFMPRDFAVKENTYISYITTTSGSDVKDIWGDENKNPYELLEQLKKHLESDHIDKLLLEINREKPQDRELGKVIPFPKLSEADEIQLIKEGKSDKAGIFIVLPKKLGKQFPSLGDFDSSKSHVTVLFIGKVPKKHYELLEETVKKVAKKYLPFILQLDEKVSYFPATKHSEGRKIAKMKVISETLHQLHKDLKKAILAAGIDIDDHFPNYKPHVTLEYMPIAKQKYDDTAPDGSWVAEAIEIWGLGDPIKIPFEKVLSKRAARIDFPRRMFEEITDWIRANSDLLKRKLLVLPGKKSLTKTFNIDISDTEQYRKHDWIPKMLSLEQSNNRHKTLAIKLVKSGPSGTEGSHIDVGGIHVIHLFHALDALKSGEIYITLKHELIHMMQALMTNMLSTKNLFTEKPSIYTGRAGIPGKYNPKTYKMYIDPEEDVLSDEELTKRHVMSDVEFFTRLNDDIEYLKRKLNTVEKNKKKDILEAFVNKSTFLNFLKTFDYDKFKRAVREIYRAFDEITATASLSKRSAQGVDLDDLRQIYEMEYKLFKLNQRPYLSDPAYMLKNKFNTKLHMLLNEIFPVFANVYGEWIDYELNLMLNANPKDLIKKEKYQQMMADLPGEHLKRALEDAKEKEIYNIWLTEQPYKGIKAVYDQLGAHRVDPNNLNPSIVLFHTALNTAHFTGKMIEHLARAFSNAKPHKIMTMLDQLSAGIDTAKWDRELTRIASGNISKRAGKPKIPQCETCGQRERELLEQVVVSFGDYSYRCNKHLLPYEASTEDVNIKPVCTAMDCFEPQVKDDEGSWLTDLCVKHYAEQKQKIQQQEQERERQLQSLLPRNCDRCQKSITNIDDLFKIELYLPGETKILYQCWKCKNDEWNRTQDIISKKKAYLSKRADVLFKTPNLPTGYNAQVAAFRDFKPEDLKIEGSTFNPSIAPGQYRVYKDKPINAIWTSTLKGSTTDWLNWNRNFSMFRDYSNQQAPLFNVSGAKVYHINSNDDYAKLREMFPRTTIMTYGSYKDEVVAGVDWDKFAKQYDAVHLADPGLGKDDYEKGIRGNRDLDWDVESTAWFNPQVLKLVDVGQIQSLTPEEKEYPEWKRKLSSKNPLEDIIVPSSDIYVGGKDKPREQLIHTMEEAEKMAIEHPSAFISLLRPSNKFAQEYEKFKVLEPLAVENLAFKEPILYFMGQYHKKNKEHNRIAAEMLLKSHAPSMYFTMGLFVEEEFKHLIPQAMEAVAEKNPKFFNELLGLEKFKEFGSKLSKRASGLGLLIDPRGKVYDVGFQGHDEFAARMLQGELTDLNFNYELPPTDFLIANGWIRVGSFRQMMSVGVGVFDDKALRMLQNAAYDLPKFKSVFVSAYLSGENKNIPYDDFMSADHANQLKVFDMRRASLSKRAGSIDVPKKMLNEIYTWMMPLREKMAAAYKKKYSDRQLSNLDLAFRMIIGGGQGSVRDLAKRLKIDTSRLDLNKTVDFFQGIDEIRNGMIERKSPGFFDKLRDGSLLKDARDNSDPNDDYKSLNIDINNSNIDFRLRVQDDAIKGVPYHCWPTIYKIVGYSSGGVYTQEDSCDPDLMYQVFEFSFNRINKKLEVYIFDEAFLRQELQRFKEWTEIIIGKAKAGALEKDLPDGFEFDFERPKLKKTVAGGWLIKNNIQFYQNFLTSISVMIHSLENYLRAIRKNKQEEIIEDHDLEITKGFKTDVSDIKQYAEFKKEIDELLTESTFSNLFSNLKVTLEIGADAKAWFNSASPEPPRIYIRENGNDLRSKNELIQDLSHELIHFVQDLLTHAIKKRNKYLQHKNWEAGMPGKYDPKSYKFYTSQYEKDPEYQKQHALSDVEFFTRLEDAVGSMRTFVRMSYITDDDLRFIQEIQPKGIIESNIYKMPVANRMKIMKNRFERYLEYDNTLKYLRQYNPEKFNKMVRELYREFDSIVRTASISKRADKLKEYKKKREFKKTPEPEGKISKRETQKFVIHKHDADRAGLHFDLRLEHEGVLESWAIKKHKLPAKGERLLAMRTEDHPLEYGKFKGTIPEGEYGAGKVDIYDSGTYETIKRTKDTIKFKLNGKKEKGSYTLHRTDGKSWILMVMKDDDNKD